MKPLDGFKVLVVDDNPDLRLLARLSLSGAGATVAVSGNATDTVDALANGQTYDLVLMDLELENGMDGLEAVRTLRRRGYTGRIAAYSAHVSADYQANAVAAGCTSFITKVGGQAELVAAVREAMA